MASNQALQNTSISVISPQYCIPCQVDLYTAKRVKRITKGRYLGAFDINGSNIFKVKTAGGFFSRRLILVDAAGVPVVSLKPVTGLWKAYRGDSSDLKDLLFSVKKSKFYHIKKNLDVFLASNITENICDFKIKEIYHDKSCIICRGDSENIIAEMHKNKAIEGKVRGKHTFSVTVYPNIDYAFVIAMRVVSDEMNKPNSRRGDGGGGSGGGNGGGGDGGGCGGGGGE